MPQPECRPVRSRAQTRQVWAERLRRFADSDLSVAAFCRSQAVSCQAFYYWKHKLNQPHDLAPNSSQSRLLPVRLLQSPPSVELALPNGCTLRLAAGCDLDFVRSLVDALGGEPC